MDMPATYPAVTYRVIVVDDHELVQAGLALMLGGSGRYRIVETLSRGSDLIPCLQTTAADVVILDLNLPDVNGTNLLIELVGRFDTTVVVMTGELDPGTIRAARAMGARAIVSKADPSPHLLRALDVAVEGDRYFSPSVMQVLEDLPKVAPSLSPRQMAILRLLGDGHSNKEIGYRLDISPPTVSFHMKEIREKLGIPSNRQIVMTAQDLGLL